MGKSLGQKIWYWLYTVPLKILKFVLLLAIWIALIWGLWSFFFGTERAHTGPSIITPLELRTGVKLSP